MEIRKLGWLGWSLSNKFKKDFPPKYNVIRETILNTIEKTKSDYTKKEDEGRTRTMVYCYVHIVTFCEDHSAESITKRKST